MAHLSYIILVFAILHYLVVPTVSSTNQCDKLAQQLTSLQAEVDTLSQRPSPSHSTCVGHVSPNEFQPYLPWGIVVHVTTNRCQFQTTPVYLTSLRGTGHHWQAIGVSSVYDATPSNFKIYLSYLDPEVRNTTQLIDLAIQYQWTVEWVGME